MPQLDPKRKGDEMALVPSAPAAKKSRTEIVATQAKDKALKLAGIARTSSLMAPIMQMEGHQGDIFTVEFHPDGQYLASSGFDRQIYFWNVHGECENISMMSGHSGAVMELHFTTDGSQMTSASTDKTVALWDIEAGVRVKRLKGHTSFVNSCHPVRRGPLLICSGSDDGTIRIWDPRKRGQQQAITLTSTYQVTAVSFNDTAQQVFSGGIDNEIKEIKPSWLGNVIKGKDRTPASVLPQRDVPYFNENLVVWDLRQSATPLYRLRGHGDTVTGLSLSPDGSYIMSNAMDASLRIWDVRPFAQQERCVKIFQGHQHNFEKNLLRCSWSPDGSKVSAGSSDRFVYVWDTTSRRVLYKLPGHNGSVNDIDFHPKEPIIVSASSDKTLYMGELEL